ncbi:MAG TPA: hypothetical protein ENL03_02140 [Phycisphaerae bacterium]|nr:hypothetical protein [Phycisphaerae bacterium]
MQHTKKWVIASSSKAGEFSAKDFSLEFYEAALSEGMSPEPHVLVEHGPWPASVCVPLKMLCVIPWHLLAVTRSMLWAVSAGC